MSQINSHSARDAEVPSPTPFSPQSEVGLAEILQLSCPERRSGQITFRSGASYGYVFIQQGQVLHAMCGTVEGEDAVYHMLTWPAGSFTLDEDILPHKRTINLTWEQLLFEGARRADVGGLSPDPALPVTTANPLTSTRMKDSQAKLIISLGDAAPQTFEIQHEYTRLGRAEDNELVLADGSISNRHCVFVLSGADVVLRDLNSSNGTYVNGEQVAETVLRPGDNIQVGVIDIKFVPGIRRPKLNPANPPRSSQLRYEADAVTLARSNTTLKLPYRPKSAATPKIADNQAYVSGTSAISYDQLAPETPPPKRPWGKIIGGAIVLLLVVAGVVYYLHILKR